MLPVMPRLGLTQGSFIVRHALLWAPGSPRFILARGRNPTWLVSPALPVAVGRSEEEICLLGGREPTPGPGWGLGVASPDSHGLRVRECGLLRKRPGALFPAGATGICWQPSPLCSYSGLCGMQLVFVVGFTFSVPRPQLRGEALDLTPKEVWPWLWLLGADHQALGMSCLRKVFVGVLCQSTGTVWFRAGLWVMWAGSQASETESP